MDTLVKFDVQHYVRSVPDWPKAGINFLDLQALYASPLAFSNAIDELTQQLHLLEFEMLVGIESRGFPLVSRLAQETGNGFMLCRKPGKLPPPVHRHQYVLEYGTDALELPQGDLPAGEIEGAVPGILIVDDVFATGGTMAACAALCRKAGYEIAGGAVLLEIAALNGRENIDFPLVSLASV